MREKKEKKKRCAFYNRKSQGAFLLLVTVPNPQQQALGTPPSPCHLPHRRVRPCPRPQRPLMEAMQGRLPRLRLALFASMVPVHRVTNTTSPCCGAYAHFSCIKMQACFARHGLLWTALGSLVWPWTWSWPRLCTGTAQNGCKRVREKKMQCTHYHGQCPNCCDDLRQLRIEQAGLSVSPRFWTVPRQHVQRCRTATSRPAM